MSYLIWDTETDTAYDRIMRTERPVLGAGESTVQAVDRVLKELCDQKNQSYDRPCFTPARFHVPNTIGLLQVDEQLRYQRHLVIANRTIDNKPDYAANARQFWNCYNSAYDESNQNLVLVDFNGLHFDCPLMEVAGLENGCDLSRWYAFGNKSWEDPRGAFAHQRHIDLFAFLSTRAQVGGGLSYWSRLIGLPGKLDTDGAMVQDMLKTADGHQRVADYCMCDVLNTYGLLFHILHCMGHTPTSFTGPVFEDTMRRVAQGRGSELQKFVQFYEAPF
jgi:hypothetical protein